MDIEPALDCTRRVTIALEVSSEMTDAEFAEIVRQRVQDDTDILTVEAV